MLNSGCQEAPAPPRALGITSFYSEEFLKELSTALNETTKQMLSVQSLREENESPFSISSENLLAEPLPCLICAKKCSGNKGLKQHIAKAHSKLIKNVECPVCNKRFKHQNAVKFHQRQVHERVNRVSCQVCGKDLYNKYMLKKHLKVHFA
mmetsp:Transcript_24768/g.43625  ORF Transcript_24768/g.43625 Transcript_24768/m.43625 type:complete len:151 (+) Transcript_24768:712-1164(+)